MEALFQALSGKTVGIFGLGYIGTGLKTYLKALPVDIKLVDITRRNYNCACDYQYDYFFNCAGNTGDFRLNPMKTIESNLAATLDLLKKIDVIETYVGLSSTRVYGFSDCLDRYHDETFSSSGDHLDIEYIYDGTKKLLESLLTNLDSVYRQKLVVARLSNVFENFPDTELNDATLLKLMVSSGRKQQKLHIQQHESSSKDYIHINDCIEGIIRCAIYGRGGQVYNIAQGQPTSLKELSKVVNPLVQFDNSRKPMHCTISIGKAQSELGFNPTMNILRHLAEKTKYESN